VPTLAEQFAGRGLTTQLGQALEAAAIAWVAARRAQTRGRVERLWGTAQDRLLVELRLAGATTRGKHPNVGYGEAGQELALTRPGGPVDGGWHRTRTGRTGAAVSGHSDMRGSRPHGSGQPEPAPDCARRSDREGRRQRRSWDRSGRSRPSRPGHAAAVGRTMTAQQKPASSRAIATTATPAGVR
jgi:hypothetical protein